MLLFGEIFPENGGSFQKDALTKGSPTRKCEQGSDESLLNGIAKLDAARFTVFID